MKGQKQAVVDLVMAALPNFVQGQDVALNLLTASQLEFIKSVITNEISGGVIEYSKDATNTVEVKTYARSMVMNHLKKAKELNGGVAQAKSSTTKTVEKKAKGVNLDLLPQDLRDYVENN